MTHYLQETDSVVIRKAPSPILFTPLHRNETLGGVVVSNYLPLPIGSSLLNKAWELAYRIENSDQLKQTKELLTLIQRSLSTIERYNIDPSYIPPLRAVMMDDGSILLEWIFRDYRVGFGIETDPQESGWFLVSNRKLGDIACYGQIFDVELDSVISWLLTFILTHA